MEITAVDFLFKEFSDILGAIVTKPMQDLLLHDAIKKAKEMEKKQIMDAYNQGYRDCEVDLNDYSMNEDIAEFTDAEQYFKQTYGG